MWTIVFNSGLSTLKQNITETKGGQMDKKLLKMWKDFKVVFLCQLNRRENTILVFNKWMVERTEIILPMT